MVLVTPAAFHHYCERKVDGSMQKIGAILQKGRRKGRFSISVFEPEEFRIVLAFGRPSDALAYAFKLQREVGNLKMKSLNEVGCFMHDTHAVSSCLEREIWPYLMLNCLICSGTGEPFPVANMLLMLIQMAYCFLMAFYQYLGCTQEYARTFSTIKLNDKSSTVVLWQKLQTRLHAVLHLDRFRSFT